MSGNTDEANLLLIANLDKKIVTNLTCLAVSLCITVTFLVLRETKIYFTSLEVTWLDYWTSRYFSRSPFFYFDYTKMIFGLFNDVLQYCFY